MDCAVVMGIWRYSRLAPDDAEDALTGESNITLELPDGEGRFTGEHVSGDPIVDGRCLGGNGSKLRIEFKRQHADGKTTTDYRGEIAYDPDNDLSFIVKGRFTRRSPDGINEFVNTNGDWTTEKPT